MQKFLNRIIISFLTLMLISSLFIGCSQNKVEQDGIKSSEELRTFPITTGETLTYWIPFNPAAAPHGANLAEIPLYKELEKRTGINIKFMHPVTGQEAEQFNLLVASGDLPDMITYDFLNFPGGPEKAINDGIITPLNNLINSYAPNLKSVLESDNEINKMVKTDEGNYYVFPFVRGDNYLTVFMGPMLRKDWLDELNLDVPTTIDEWHTVLTAFKEQKNAEAPFTIQIFNTVMKTTSAFVGAYGVKDDFYIENGKMIYGPIQNGYKEYLTTMHQWYNEGLLDSDFASNDRNAVNAKFLSNRAGSTVGWTGGTMGTYLDSMADKGTGFDIIAAPYPTLKKGETPKFGQQSHRYPGSLSVAISNKSTNKQLAAQWLDYGYSEEGHLLFNFGIENESYEMIDGYPTYSELVTNNPKGLPMSQAMGAYVKSLYGGPFVQDRRYMEQYSNYEQQKNAIETWGKTDESKHVVPPIIPTPEESREYSSIMNDINTYKEEMILKIIFGQESLDNFDKYVAQIKSMGIDRAIEIQQNSLERYNNR